jgi:hypothetical protein
MVVVKVGNIFNQSCLIPLKNPKGLKCRQICLKKCQNATKWFYCRIQFVDVSPRISPPLVDPEQRLEMFLGFHPLRADHLGGGLHHLLLLLRVQLCHLLKVSP